DHGSCRPWLDAEPMTAPSVPSGATYAESSTRRPRSFVALLGLLLFLGVPTTAAPSRPSSDALRYLNEHGGNPARFPQPGPTDPPAGIFSVCLNTPVERLRLQFGIEDERVSLGHGMLALTWSFHGISVDAYVDRVGSTKLLRVSLTRPAVRVALPD